MTNSRIKSLVEDHKMKDISTIPRDSYELDEKFSFEEFMQVNFKELKISVKVFEKYFIDIGIPEDYQKAQSEIKNHI